MQNEEIMLSISQQKKLQVLLSSIPEDKTSLVGRIFEKVDEILSRTTVLLLWGLEFLGIAWLSLSIGRFNKAIIMMQKAETAEKLNQAKELLNAIKVSADATNGMIVAFCVGLPAFVGGLRALRKIWKEKNGNGHSQADQESVQKDKENEKVSAGA